MRLIQRPTCIARAIRASDGALTRLGTLSNLRKSRHLPQYTSLAKNASCPTLNLTANQRDRIRRQRGRSRGRAELAFDFYDDWDEDENDALMGWSGNDEFDRLLSGDVGYGTLSSQVQNQQPGRPRGMSYPKARRRSTVDSGPDPTVIPGSSNFFAKLFGGKARILRYQPSAADLQDNPGARKLGRNMTEGEALLQEGGEVAKKKHRRSRSETVTSGHTTSSLSSRGDIFPSDEEDDAIPLDDEFAMVLERRTTQSGGASGPDTETSSGKTRGSNERRRGKRPSAGSRASTLSSRSRGGSRKRRSRTNSSAAQTPIDEVPPERFGEEEGSTLNELKKEESHLEQQEEADVERRRQEAQKLAAERGFVDPVPEPPSSKEATPLGAQSPVLQPVQRTDEPSQLPTPLATDDEDEEARPASVEAAKGTDDNDGSKS